MIEGLRAAPWWNEARTAGQAPKNCDDCMATTSLDTRRQIGCGYLLQAEKPRRQPPIEALSEGNAHEWDTCPGYTTSLREVEDASHALAWSTNGELELYCDGRPAPSLLAAVGVLRVAVRGFESHKMRHPDKKGGA